MGAFGLYRYKVWVLICLRLFLTLHTTPVILNLENSDFNLSYLKILVILNYNETLFIPGLSTPNMAVVEVGVDAPYTYAYTLHLIHLLGVYLHLHQTFTPKLSIFLDAVYHN